MNTEKPEIDTGDDAFPVPHNSGRTGMSLLDYFAACPGDPDDELWAGMVELGLAYLHSGPTEMFPYNCYRTTELGQSVAKREPQDAKKS